MKNIEIIKNMSEQEYFALEAINHSTLSKYSLGEFQAKHAIYSPPKETSEALNTGKAIHEVLLYGLEFFAKKYIVMPKVDGRTKAGKAKKAEIQAQAMEESKSIIDEATRDTVMSVYASISKHELASGLLRTDDKEVTLIGDLDNGYKFKARVDAINTDLDCFIDIKTTRHTTIRGLQKSLVDFNYFSQMGWYSKALCEAGYNIDSCVIIFVQNEAPFEIMPVKLMNMDIELGYRQCEEWLDTHTKCIENDKWESAFKNISVIEMPIWKHEELKEKFY